MLLFLFILACIWVALTVMAIWCITFIFTNPRRELGTVPFYMFILSVAYIIWYAIS